MSQRENTNLSLLPGLEGWLNRVHQRAIFFSYGTPDLCPWYSGHVLESRWHPNVYLILLFVVFSNKLISVYIWESSSVSREIRKFKILSLLIKFELF